MPDDAAVIEPKQENTGAGDWMQCMRNGLFEQAWKFSDIALAEGVNRDYNHLPRHFQNIWDGTPLNNKRVLIRCYHGLGDTIQFIRYAPLVKSIAAEVAVWAQPALIPLLETVKDIDRLMPLHDGVPEVAYNVDTEVMELPYIFRSTIATIPNKVPYLHVPPLQLSTNKSKLAVGLVWQAGDWDQARCIPFQHLQPLFNIDSADIFILQANAAAAGWREDFGINPGEFNLYDYARAIRGLDLLITVDSMPAHLAGALNVPVWTLLREHADWRWMQERKDSPWYPSMKLFRQKIEGDWKTVIGQVAEELKSIAAARH